MKKISILSTLIVTMFIYNAKSLDLSIGARVAGVANTRLIAPLNFGTIITSGTAGTLTIDPSGPSMCGDFGTNGITTDTCSSDGGIILIEGVYEGDYVTLSSTPPSALTHSDGETTMAFSPLLYKLDPAGGVVLTNNGDAIYGTTSSDQAMVLSGGTLSVGATQKPGSYSASWPVSFEY